MVCLLVSHVFHALQWNGRDQGKHQYFTVRQEKQLQKERNYTSILSHMIIDCGFCLCSWVRLINHHPLHPCQCKKKIKIKLFGTEGLDVFKYHSLFCSECFIVTLAPMSPKYCFVMYVVWTVGKFLKKTQTTQSETQPHADQVRMIWEAAVSHSIVYGRAVLAVSLHAHVG